MPGITNPAEEYFKDGTWAWDPAGGKWLKLIIDPLTNRLVIDHPGDLEVVQPVPADLCVANYGWDGSAWRKLPLVWGYSDRWSESLGETKDGDGTYAKFSTAVPAGYVYVMQGLCFSNSTGARGHILLHIYDGTTFGIFANSLAPARYQVISIIGEFCLKQGDKVYVTQTDCLDNDVVASMVWGYKMKIAE